LFDDGLSCCFGTRQISVGYARRRDGQTDRHGVVAWRARSMRQRAMPSAHRACCTVNLSFTARVTPPTCETSSCRLQRRRQVIGGRHVASPTQRIYTAALTTSRRARVSTLSPARRTTPPVATTLDYIGDTRIKQAARQRT